MDYEILVRDFAKIVKILKQGDKHVALFMLKPVYPDISVWSLVVSTQTYDNMTKKNAIRHLINLLNKNFRENFRKKIIGIAVLQTDDPFVKEMNWVFSVTDSVKFIESSVIAGIHLERAIVFESVRSAASQKATDQYLPQTPNLTSASI